jgi:hypothetical protein
MPLQTKILLSVIVVALSGLLAWYENLGPQPHLIWVVATIAMIMIFGLWVFPEAGGGKPEPASDHGLEEDPSAG